MNNSNNNIRTVFFVVFFLINFCIMAVCQTTKVVSSIHTVPSSQVKLNVPCDNVEYKSIPGSRIVIETTVEIDRPLTVLEYLIKHGRYSKNVTVDAESGITTIEYQSRPFLVNVDERITKVVIYVPNTIKVI